MDDFDNMQYDREKDGFWHCSTLHKLLQSPISFFFEVFRMLLLFLLLLLLL